MRMDEGISILEVSFLSCVRQETPRISRVLDRFKFHGSLATSFDEIINADAGEDRPP
jgi:hypothetical protein